MSPLEVHGAIKWQQSKKTPTLLLQQIKKKNKDTPNRPRNRLLRYVEMVEANIVLNDIY